MMKRWLTILILTGACEPQPAQPGARNAAEVAQADEARWWCVFSADGYSSNCERALVDCESDRKPPRRRDGACEPAALAHCFRYVNKGLAIHGTVVNECAALPTHCEDRRAHLSETLGPASVVSECERTK